MRGRPVADADKVAFLSALEEGATTRDAARSVGRSSGTFYSLRDHDERFREAWDAIAPVGKRSNRPRSGFVSAAPFRKAIGEAVPPGERSEFARLIGARRTLVADVVSGKQQTLSAEDAELLAAGLERFDLWAVDDSSQGDATISPVGARPCPKSDFTSVEELLEREARAWKALKLDPSIHPADALAMVVWPPAHVLEDAA